MFLVLKMSHGSKSRNPGISTWNSPLDLGTLDNENLTRPVTSDIDRQ